MANKLYAKTGNKIFKDITPEDFGAVLEKMITEKKSQISNADAISNFYKKNEYDPQFLMEHYFNGDLKVLTGYFNNAKEHGLNPDMFEADKIDSLIKKIGDKNAIKTVEEAYQDMARLELLSANSFINYTNALQFGIINPHKIYNRYYTKTLQPDSISMDKALQTSNFKTYLDSIQPKSVQYKALQKALLTGVAVPGMNDVEAKRIIKVNLERLRWKNKPSENRYVIVNIPDYTLDVMDSGRSVMNMKVCVGQGRNRDNANTLISFADSCKTDKPFPKETPQLNSIIYEAQVNPVWNIPQSIATKEIIVEAAKDKFYLSNKNIEVYKNGKKIDADEINWSAVKNPSDYEFKQKPGDDNSLGKVKFMFRNKSSVYLHDTPAKLAFKYAMRSVSHGCVRLEKPLDFAHALFGDGPKYDMIAKFMSQDNPTSTTISLSRKTPVYITYFTCWADNTGTLQFRHDVYGLDIVLYSHLTPYLW